MPGIDRATVKSGAGTGQSRQMPGVVDHPVVHLELWTTNLSRACAFYAELFGWRPESITVGSGTYLALELGVAVTGGVVEREEGEAKWLPYVEVEDVFGLTERARRLGAAETLAPREGPGGWRSVLAVPAGAEIALWQPKT